MIPNLGPFQLYTRKHVTSDIRGRLRVKLRPRHLHVRMTQFRHLTSAMTRRTTAATANTQGRPRKRPSTEPVATPVRSSKRAKTNGQLSITQKARQGSKYFEHDLKDGGSATVESRKAESEIGDEASEYEDEDRDSDSAVSSPVTADSDLDQDQSDELSDDNVKSKRRKLKKKQITGSVARIEVPRGQELWRQDVKTGLGPGKQVIIKLPKPRTAGSTPYHPETIHPNTLSFLKDLAMNNDREWLKSRSASVYRLTTPRKANASRTSA